MKSSTKESGQVTKNPHPAVAGPRERAAEKAQKKARQIEKLFEKYRIRSLRNAHSAA
jgi:hypothetical protein